MSAYNSSDSKVHGANMRPIWGRQDPGGPHVDPMNFAIWEDVSMVVLWWIQTMQSNLGITWQMTWHVSYLVFTDGPHANGSHTCVATNVTISWHLITYILVLAPLYHCKVVCAILSNNLDSSSSFHVQVNTMPSKEIHFADQQSKIFFKKID